jgi:hypothetical protein
MTNKMARKGHSRSFRLHKGLDDQLNDKNRLWLVKIRVRVRARVRVRVVVTYPEAFSPSPAHSAVCGCSHFISHTILGPKMRRSVSTDMTLRCVKLFCWPAQAQACLSISLLEQGLIHLQSSSSSIKLTITEYRMSYVPRVKLRLATLLWPVLRRRETHPRGGWGRQSWLERGRRRALQWGACRTQRLEIITHTTSP